MKITEMIEIIVKWLNESTDISEESLDEELRYNPDYDIHCPEGFNKYERLKEINSVERCGQILGGASLVIEDNIIFFIDKDGISTRITAEEILSQDTVYN